MNTENPVLDLYAAIYRLFQSEHVLENELRLVLELAKHPGIELSERYDVTEKEVRHWHEIVCDNNSSWDCTTEIAEAMFIDLAGQMRNPDVQRLFNRFCASYGMGDDVFVFERRRNPVTVGGDMVTIATVVSHPDRYDKFHESPEHFNRGDGRLHYLKKIEEEKSGE